MARLSRRTLLCTGAAAAVAVAPLSTPAAASVLSADAGLLHAVAEAARLNLLTISTMKAARLNLQGLEAQVFEEREAEVFAGLQPAYAELDAHLDTIIATPSRTAEGMRAKAEAVVEWMPGSALDIGREVDLDKQLLASLLRDLVGRA